MSTYHVLVEKEWSLYVAHNLELGVVSQGQTYEESLVNLKEATSLYLEDESDNIDRTYNYWEYALTSIAV